MSCFNTDGGEPENNSLWSGLQISFFVADDRLLTYFPRRNFNSHRASFTTPKMKFEDLIPARTKVGDPSLARRAGEYSLCDSIRE